MDNYIKRFIEQQEQLKKYIGIHRSSFSELNVRLYEEQRKIDEITKPLIASEVLKIASDYNFAIKGIEREIVEKIGFLKSTINPLIEKGHEISKVFKKFEQFESLRKYFNELNASRLEISKVDLTGIESITKILRDIQFNIGQNGTFIIDDESHTYDEVQNSIDNLLKKDSLDIKKKSPHSIINFLLKFIQSPKGIIFIIFIWPFIQNFLSDNIISPIWKNLKRSYFKKSQKIILKEIRKDKSSHKIDFKSIRFVTVKTLNVRFKNSRKSSKIGELHFSDIVQLMKKKKKWCLIFFKKGDIEIKGWVYSKYLKKII